MDSTAPSIGLVVEVKLTRPGSSFATVVEEVADAALFWADPHR